MTKLNTITIQNNSLLDTTKYTVWVAGYIGITGGFMYLQNDGNFKSGTGSTTSFININSGLTVSVPDAKSTGNNRLVFTVTDIATTPANLSTVTGYTAYPFPGAPGVCPPGPYDIFEFGPNAQYDVSAVDSFGLNLSFTVINDSLTYGAVPSIARTQIGAAFTTFTQNDPLGTGFQQLLYTSPVGSGYPDQIEGGFSAIVSPKDWLAIYPAASGLADYWTETVNNFFTKGNQINLYLNAATVGNYSGTSDGSQFTLTGPVTTSSPKGVHVIIPASDFAGNQGFIQAVRGQNKGETAEEYNAFSQIEAAIFEAISRGVLLDGVVASGSAITKNYTSDAWINYTNWFTNHNNAYNSKPSVYDVYAKFFHYAQFTVPYYDKPINIFGTNTDNTFGMAYGFSLDENPNVGSWSVSNNVPSKTPYNVGAGQDVTLMLAPWGGS